MRGDMILILLILVAGAIDLAGCQVGPPPHMPDIGKTQVAQGAMVEADAQALTEILDTFGKTEEALAREDLDALMAIYSQTYKYHTYDKARLRLLWKDLFRSYNGFSSRHMFSKIVVQAEANPPTAEITCSGSIWAVSRLTGLRVNLDSWFGEVHYLIFEDGAWRIRGHAWEMTDPGRYVLSPHPFF